MLFILNCTNAKVKVINDSGYSVTVWIYSSSETSETTAIEYSAVNYDNYATTFKIDMDKADTMVNLKYYQTDQTNTSWSKVYGDFSVAKRSTQTISSGYNNVDEDK